MTSDVMVRPSTQHGQVSGQAGSMQPLHSNSLSADLVSAIMSIVHSRDKNLHSHIPAMSQHLICLSAAGSDMAANYPPRVLTLAKHAARKWILDIFSSTSKEEKNIHKYTVPLWAALEAVSSDCTEVCDFT